MKQKCLRGRIFAKQLIIFSSRSSIGTSFSNYTAWKWQLEKKNHDLAPEIAANTLMQSFSYASHQCGRDSPTPITVYIRSRVGRNTATTQGQRLKGLCDSTLSGHLACACAWAHEPGGRWCTVPISMYCHGPPVTVYIRWLELENLGHTGGLRSLNSALGCRLWVQAPGRGSFSPLATFKLCS